VSGKGNLANLKPFKPGQSGNPAGRAGVLPPEVRSERKRNQAELIRTITKIFMMTDSEIEKHILENPPTQLQAAVIKLIGSAKEGDVTAFKYLTEVMVGKIPEHDYDGFTEEDLRILNRIKEVYYEKANSDEPAPGSLGSSH
jgi:hypothetical protein